jgi:hypothetical protein
MPPHVHLTVLLAVSTVQAHGQLTSCYVTVTIYVSISIKKLRNWVTYPSLRSGCCKVREIYIMRMIVICNESFDAKTTYFSESSEISLWLYDFSFNQNHFTIFYKYENQIPKPFLYIKPQFKINTSVIKLVYETNWNHWSIWFSIQQTLLYTPTQLAPSLQRITYMEFSIRLKITCHGKREA